MCTQALSSEDLHGNGQLVGDLVSLGSNGMEEIMSSMLGELHPSASLSAMRSGDGGGQNVALQLLMQQQPLVASRLPSVPALAEEEPFVSPEEPAEGGPPTSAAAATHPPESQQR